MKKANISDFPFSGRNLIGMRIPRKIKKILKKNSHQWYRHKKYIMKCLQFSKTKGLLIKFIAAKK